jgi:ankyrin repeat protein
VLLGRSRRVEVTGPREADGSLRANRFGSVAGQFKVSGKVTMYLVALPDLSTTPEQVAVDLEHLALDWLDADVALGEAMLVTRRERLIEQTVDAELVARLLAEPGIDPNAAAAARIPGNTRIPNTNGDIHTPLARAAELGHLEAARLLLDAGADVGCAPPVAEGDSFTPLMQAAGNGHLEVLRLLLGRGAAVDAVQLGSGFTAFQCACIYNQPECVEVLIRAGCDVGRRWTSMDDEGRTGRELAEAAGHLAVVERLRAVVAEQPRVAQAAGPAPEPEPEPASLAGERLAVLAPMLVTAAMEGDGAAVTRWLSAGADPDASATARTPDGEVLHTTALIRAAQNGRLEAARLLLDAGADPGRARTGGVTPLMAAAGLGQLQVLLLLLGYGAAVDAAQPASGFTAFHCACFRNQVECAEALIRAGCDVGIKTKGGETGRELALGRGHAALLARLDALGAERPAGGGEAQGPGVKKKRKKRPKKKRPAPQPGAELEPEFDPEFESEPELEPHAEPEPEQMLQPEPQLELQPEPLLEPEPVADLMMVLLAGLGLLEHLPACRAHEMDLGARPRNAPGPSSNTAAVRARSSALCSPVLQCALCHSLGRSSHPPARPDLMTGVSWPFTTPPERLIDSAWPHRGRRAAAEHGGGPRGVRDQRARRRRHRRLLRQLARSQSQIRFGHRRILCSQRAANQRVRSLLRSQKSQSAGARARARAGARARARARA